MRPTKAVDVVTPCDGARPAYAPHELHLSAVHTVLIERGARSARPLEYCAALLGEEVDSRLIVTDVVRLRNSDTRRGCFVIADAEIRRARCVARELGRKLLAILHSHAENSPIPSGRDRTAMAYSQYPWVIAGFDAHDVVQFAAFDAGSGDPLPIALLHA